MPCHSLACPGLSPTHPGGELQPPLVRVGQVQLLEQAVHLLVAVALGVLGRLHPVPIQPAEAQHGKALAQLAVAHNVHLGLSVVNIQLLVGHNGGLQALHWG